MNTPRYYLTLLAGLALIACAKLQTPLESKSHPHGWTEKASPEFHANKVIAIGTVSCISCHGNNLGENDSFCVKCHSEQTTPVCYPHPPEWMRFSDPKNHAAFVVAHEGNLTCNHCHKVLNYRAPSCSDCHLGKDD